MRQRNILLVFVLLSFIAIISLLSCTHRQDTEISKSDVSGIKRQIPDQNNKIPYKTTNELSPPTIPENLEPETVEIICSWMNVIDAACNIYINITGEYPVSLQQMYDSGFLFCIPFNHIQNKLMSLDNDTSIGNAFINVENGKATVRMYLSDKSGSTPIVMRLTDPDDASYKKLFNQDPYLKDYYSDTKHQSLFAIMMTIKMSQFFFNPESASDLVTETAWPIDYNGKNPITGEPLERGNNPGQYNLVDRTIGTNQLIQYVVYDEGADPIPNPFMRKSNNKGDTWYDDWHGIMLIH